MLIDFDFFSSFTYVCAPRGVDPYGTGGTCPPIFMKVMVMSPNILEVMSFRMSTRVDKKLYPDPQGKWMTYLLLYFSA